MAAWGDIERAEPEFAGRVRRLFETGRHKTLATVRADGSPRISGIECEFVDGQLTFGSMTHSRKLADLLHDPRFALHGPTFHPEVGKENEWPGEAKIAGRATRVDDVHHDQTDQPTDQPADQPADEPEGVSFVADVTEVVITGLDAAATMLVVEFWTPEFGLRRVERA